MFEKLYLKRISKKYDIDINNYSEVIYLKKVLEDMSQYLSGNILSFKTKVEFLEEFFKHRGVHEFKKAEFANLVKQNIKDISDVSEEIVEIIDEIKGTYSPL